MKVKGQAKFIPTQYVHALAKAFEKAGGVIVQQCRLTGADENENVEVETSNVNFKGKALVYATHIPPGVIIIPKVLSMICMILITTIAHRR